MLNFVKDVRLDVDHARCAAHAAALALAKQNTDDSEEIETTIALHVCNALHAQVEKLDGMIECVEIQEVYRV